MAATGSVYAKYIGRIGALAVALGVTGAMATSPGVAWADETSSNGASNTSPTGTASGSGQGSTSTQTPSTGSTTTGSTDGTGTTTTTGTTTGTTSGTTTGTSTGTSGSTGTTTQGGSQTETDLGGGVIVRSSGGNTSNTAVEDENGDTDETPNDTTDVEETGTEEEFGTEETGGTGAGEEVPDSGQAGGDETDGTGVTPGGSHGSTPGTTDPTPPTTVNLGGTTTINESGKNDNESTDNSTTSKTSQNQGTTSLSSQTTGGSSTAQLLSAAVAQTATPTATSSSPISALIAQLPTSNDVFQQVKSFVTACACTIINQTLKLVSGLSKTISSLMASGSGGGTGDPAQTPIQWTVLAWVRRQVDYAVAAFNRSPIGEWVHGVTTQITTTIANFGASPLGRTISSQVAQFLQGCGGTTPLPADLDRVAVVGGLTEPTDFDFITQTDENGMQHTDIVIIEKAGAIKIYHTEDDTVSTLTTLPTSTANGERGLVGVEVDPEFDIVGAEGYHKIYVAYTNGQNYDQLSKLTVSANLDQVLTEDVLLTSDQLANDFHHGGELEFDPTGTYLYWAVGNNIDSSNSHDLTTIHGKILRLNRDGSAPEDNPYYDDPDPKVIKQIYAIGFRNPFRFGFTPDGQLLSGDVGEATWEELNLIVAGGDYGWPEHEGPCDSNCGDTISPLYTYHHSLPPANVGSITSVLYYDGTALPEEYRNKVFIADYSVGWIKVLTFDDQFQSLISAETLDSSAGATVQLKQGPDGNIYQLNIYPGTLNVITASGGNKTPIAHIDASATNTADDSLTVDFSAAGSTDPDSPNLTYQWNFGNGQTSTNVAPTVTFTNTGADYTAYTVTLTVSDGAKSNTTTQRIVVGSTPPTIQLGNIVDSYNAGDIITFSATANDDQDGPLAASAFEWKVVFHHSTHTHPFVNSIVGTSGSIKVPTTDDQLYNTWYRISLTVTDSSGLKTTTYKDVFPNVVDFTATASDPGATFTVDGVPHVGSFTERAVVGVQRVLSAPSPQHTSAGELVFVSWSDGQGQTHTITTPSSGANYTVTFGPAPALV